MSFLVGVAIRCSLRTPPIHPSIYEWHFNQCPSYQHRVLVWGPAKEGEDWRCMDAEQYYHVQNNYDICFLRPCMNKYWLVTFTWDHTKSSNFVNARHKIGWRAVERRSVKVRHDNEQIWQYSKCHIIIISIMSLIYYLLPRGQKSCRPQTWTERQT